MNNNNQGWSILGGLIFVIIVIASLTFAYYQGTKSSNKDYDGRIQIKQNEIERLNAISAQKDAALEKLEEQIAIKTEKSKRLYVKYRSEKALMQSKLEKAKQIKKPEGWVEIQKGFERHGYEVKIIDER